MFNFIHFRPDPQDSKSGALTVCFREEEDPFVDPENPNSKVIYATDHGERAMLYFGFAFCSPKDNFCKKKGRQIAQGRVLHNKQHGVYTILKEGESPRDVAVQVANSFFHGRKAFSPRWARRWVLSRHSNEPSIRITEDKRKELEKAHGDA